ncbi:hypothetical protein ABTX62_06020 [Streptomyces sp. NPDC096046]|uniref:hypothetical protein n=1 Tax=Streptomyces sp. NPDC096046 TaxID=3155542 RepID=UPI00331773D0
MGDGVPTPPAPSPMDGVPDHNPAAPTRTSDPEDVAALYRQLREAFEDGKNEPGAADFHYGGCEMPRHDTTGTIKGEAACCVGTGCWPATAARLSRLHLAPCRHERDRAAPEVAALAALAALAARLPAAGHFARFIKTSDHADRFGFGREPDRRAAPSWAWDDLE